MSYWIIDRMVPGVADGMIVLIIGYIKLHFEKSWPYWGRRHGDGKS